MVPIVVCFDGGNLVHVAASLRQRWPALPFLMCGDDHRHAEAKGHKNAGRVKAAAAADVAGAALGLARREAPSEIKGRIGSQLMSERRRAPADCDLLAVPLLLRVHPRLTCQNESKPAHRWPGALRVRVAD